MRVRSWTWLLSFTKLLTCLALVTSLWGCTAQYQIMPTASGLPTSAQVERERVLYAIPPDLRARLDAVVKENGQLAENVGANRQFVGQMLDPQAHLQKRLLETVLAWAGEKPTEERLTLQTRQMQEGAAEEPSIRDDPTAQFAAGATAGAAIGAVPLGPFAADVAIELKVLPKGTYWGRVGRVCGEFVSGVVEMALGCAGMSSGVGLSGTGGGSVVGVPLVVASYALALNGASSASHALHDAGQLLREGPPPDADPPQPEIRLLEKPKAKPAPTPTAAPAKPAPAKPAQPAAQVESTTTTYDRTTKVTTTTTASGTTTVTKPRVKGKPSSDAPKDVAKPRGGENPAAAQKPSTLNPGPHAKESIPAHAKRPTATEQRDVNALMNRNGCHTCGTKNAQTTTGNAVADHQPPKALGTPTEFYPHCLGCARRQGGEVLKELRAKRKASQ